SRHSLDGVTRSGRSPRRWRQAARVRRSRRPREPAAALSNPRSATHVAGHQPAVLDHGNARLQHAGHRRVRGERARIEYDYGRGPKQFATSPLIAERPRGCTTGRSESDPGSHREALLNTTSIAGCNAGASGIANRPDARTDSPADPRGHPNAAGDITDTDTRPGNDQRASPRQPDEERDRGGDGVLEPRWRDGGDRRKREFLLHRRAKWKLYLDSVWAGICHAKPVSDGQSGTHHECPGRPRARLS